MGCGGGGDGGGRGRKAGMAGGSDKNALTHILLIKWHIRRGL